MTKESASIKTAFFLMKDWNRNLNLQNNWAAMYTLIFIFVPAPLTLSHPTARSFCFLKLSVIKEQSIICQVLLQVFSGTPALTVWEKTLGQGHEALGEAKNKPCREQHWQSHRNLCVCVCICVHVCLRTPDKFVQGSIWFVGTAFPPHYPAVFLALENRW